MIRRKRLFWRRAMLWLAAGAVVPMLAQAADTPPIPDKPVAEMFEGVPAPWRDYLIQARAAERIADPLQRCLAFPDLPGNEWPVGHAAAHCRDHAIRTMTRAEIAAYIDRGDFEGLERRMDVFLQRHFSTTDFGEGIHYALGNFYTSSPEVERLSAIWLEHAPESAYANAARAFYFESEAWDARGGDYASQTPRESMRRMSGFVDQAIPLFDKAIRIEPRLMPAYVGLLNAGMVDSRDEVEQRAIEGAHAIDPACLPMARQRMRSISPRWGGSYERMLAYGNELSAYLEQRPQLAVYVGAAYADRGDRLIDADDFGSETAEVLDIAIRKGSNEDALSDAANVAFNPDAGEPQPWKGLAYLLQAVRFQPVDVWGDNWIAEQLIRHEPQWSLKYSGLALALSPQDGIAHYWAGTGYYDVGWFDEAERHYLAAVEDDKLHRRALTALSAMWLYDSGLEPGRRAAKAKPYIAKLLREYPEYGAAWLMRMSEQAIELGYIDGDTATNFLKYADRNDPRQARAVEALENVQSDPRPEARKGRTAP